MPDVGLYEHGDMLYGMHWDTPALWASSNSEMDFRSWL